MKLSIIFIAILNSHSSNSGPFGFFDPNGLSIFHNLVIPKDFDINNPKSFKCFNVTNTFDGEHWNPFTVPLSDMFNRFLIKYNKKYSKEEVLLRKANMYRAMLAIAGSILKCHNHEIGHTCNFGLTSISDMSTDEFKRLCGTKPSKHSKVKINSNSKQLRSTISNAVCQPKTTGSLPQSLDWRNINSANCLTPVQNQGSCGNCWDFSTTSTIESQKLIKTGCPKPPNINYDLSEQDLLNCVSDSDCNGGYIDSAMAYVVANCQATAAAVPYVTKRNTCNHYPLVNGTCISNYCEKGVTVKGQINPDSQIMRDLNEIGPCVSVIDATTDLQNYKSGIYNSSSCSSNYTNSNHAITIVGYGTQGGVNYWICKNSWGTSWGLSGYFWIIRGVNMCGINNVYYYPIMTSAASVNRTS